MDFFRKLFDTSDFPARWNCGAWTAEHGWLHILSDLAVWLAYLAIPCVLAYFLWRRRDIPFRRIFWLFAAFVLACGTTHLMEAVIFWWPAYRLAGVIKLTTAVVSWLTVVALVRVTPSFLTMRSPEELEREIIGRQEAEAALQASNLELANQVDELRASEERFRLLVEGASGHAIFMLEPSGRVASWNLSAERILGFRSEEIVGRHFSRFYPDDAVKAGKPEDELQQATLEGRCEDEAWRQRKDGSQFWANVVVTALKDPRGNLRGFCQITRDMTERREAEQNSRRLLEVEAARRAAEQNAAIVWEERERLRVTLRSIGDGVITTDAAGNVTLLNPVAEQLTGWRNDDASGRPLLTVFPIINEMTGHEAENPVAKVLREGRAVGLANHTLLLSQNGEARPIDDSAAPIMDDQGRLLGVVLVFRDATEQRLSERRRAARLALTQTLTEAASVAEAAPHILKALAESFDWKAGCFWNVDNSGSELRCLSVWHQNSVADSALIRESLHRTSNRESGLLGRVWKERQPAWVNDLSLESGLPRNTAALEEGLHSELAFPITAGEQVLCIIELFDDRPQQPDVNLLEMFSSFATSIAQYLERRQAEEMLRQEREWFRTTLASIGDAVITTDTGGNITFLNAVAESLTGQSPAAALGQKLATVLHIIDESSRLPISDPMELAVRSGKAAGLANRALLIDGNGVERPIDNTAASIRDDQGTTVGVVLVFRDVTERRADERKIAELNRDLRRRVTEFQTLIELLPVGIAVAEDPQCARIWNNPAMARMLEAPFGAHVVLSTPAAEGAEFRFHDGDHELSVHELPMQRAMAQNAPVTDVRSDLTLASGRRLTLLQYAVPLHDEQGRVRGGLYVAVDVTSHERALKALREAEQRWRSLTEALPNLVWTDLPNGQCDWLSSQWGRYTGIPENELLGLHWLHEVIHPGDRERTLACWNAACADLGDYDLEFRIKRHDGEYRWFKTRGVPVRDEAGRIVYWFGTCTDIHDQKQAEHELQEADRRKNEFLATLAHELRNPLAPLRTGVQVLRLTDDAAARKRALEMMERQLAQMVRLIDDLLDISRITRNRLELRRARVSLAAVIENAVETARPLIDAKGHLLSVELPVQPIYLDADLTRLAQVFWNLLNNSAKYTDPGGEITLSARVDGGEVAVRVRDSGIGIPSEALPQLFKIFSQVDQSLERSQGGLGIGLALVKGLVEMHSGSIVATSAGLGRGSEFTVRLPIVESVGTAETPSASNGTGSAAKRRKILIVDDNRDGAATLGMMLALMGHETRTAHDGVEAIELAEAFRPDVLLLDIGLPRLNGYEVCRRIRAQSWGEPMLIVAVTGWGQDEDRRRSDEAGFDRHLVKPIDNLALNDLLKDFPVRPASSISRQQRP